MLGGVKLQMVLGDIVTGGTDVIVNTTDFQTHSGTNQLCRFIYIDICTPVSYL